MVRSSCGVIRSAPSRNERALTVITGDRKAEPRAARQDALSYVRMTLKKRRRLHSENAGASK
jgi:hypothetical protein